MNENNENMTDEPLNVQEYSYVEYHLQEYLKAQTLFLEANGWVKSCDYPDNQWRWEKDFRRARIAVSQTEAVSIQRQMTVAERLAEKNGG